MCCILRRYLGELRLLYRFQNFNNMVSLAKNELQKKSFGSHVATVMYSRCHLTPSQSHGYCSFFHNVTSLWALFLDPRGRTDPGVKVISLITRAANHNSRAEAAREEGGAGGGGWGGGPSRTPPISNSRLNVLWKHSCRRGGFAPT